MAALRVVAVSAVAFSAVVGVVAATRQDAAPEPAPSRRACAYAAHSLAALGRFEEALGAPVDCALVYNDVAVAWADWEQPWFTKRPKADEDWVAWRAAAPGRSLIISQSLVAAGELDGDWRAQGAAGAYDEHYRVLARNLVAAGLGTSVIRLAPEANDTANPNHIGRSDAEIADWRALWARAVAAMRSVDGARFRFDWCVNAYWEPIPFERWYPGDASVDVIGVDVYDNGIAPGPERWRRIRERAASVDAIVAFARARDRPLSVPEWALVPPDQGGGGDDVEFIAGVADLVRDARVEYQSYWFAREYADQLLASPRALAELRRRFGPGGDAAPTS